MTLQIALNPLPPVVDHLFEMAIDEVVNTGRGPHYDAFVKEMINLGLIDKEDATKICYAEDIDGNPCHGFFNGWGRLIAMHE